MATPVLNNGIFLRDTAYQASSHVDSYHLVNMLKDAEPMDLGPVDLWAMAQKVEMPLYQMSSFGGKNVIMVDNHRGEYRWQTPVSIDLPYIVEDIEDPNRVLVLMVLHLKSKLTEENLDMVISSLMTNTMVLRCTLLMKISFL
jgi:hypothetical protein